MSKYLTALTLLLAFFASTAAFAGDGDCLPEEPECVCEGGFCMPAALVGLNEVGGPWELHLNSRPEYYLTNGLLNPLAMEDFIEDASHHDAPRVPALGEVK